MDAFSSVAIPPRASSADRIPAATRTPRRAAGEVPGCSEAGAGGLGKYFRELSGLDLMSREEELAAATRIVALRRDLWRALLGHAPFVERIRAMAREMLPADASVDAGEALPEALAGADLDGVVAERVLAAVNGGELVADESVMVRYRSNARANHGALVAAKQAFVAANLRLVVTLARRFGSASLPLEDLIQEGNVGLMKAVDRFDHRKGFRFSTYGAWWIRHAIGRAIVDKGRCVRLPAQIVQGCAKVKRACREFEVLHGRRPTDAEVTELTGVPGEQIRRMRWALVEGHLSLEQPIAGDGELTLLDTLKDGDMSPTDALEQAAQADRLRRALAVLTPMQADIVRARAGIDCDDEASLAELAERYGLSRERIRQIQEQAQSRLRRELTRKPLP
jgi:RNA polymerase primary sigma factor